MTQSLRKAVFPVAGLGTRFLPATKAVAKEMLPVIDKPLIQYAAEEAVEAGITELIFITGRTKRSIEDHFDRAIELEIELESRDKGEMLALIRNILPARVSCVYIRQAEPLGLGHAVLCARPAVGNEPFAVLLPDDLIHNASRGCVSQMAACFERTGCSLIAVEPVPDHDTDKYGIVEVEDGAGTANRIKGIVEKPAPEAAPSNLGVVGRYVLTPGIFDLLETTRRGAGDEIQLTDAIAALLERERVDAFAFEGKRYDCGSKFGFLEATVELALGREDMGAAFEELIGRLV